MDCESHSNAMKHYEHLPIVYPILCERCTEMPTNNGINTELRHFTNCASVYCVCCLCLCVCRYYEYDSSILPFTNIIAIWLMIAECWGMGWWASARPTIIYRICLWMSGKWIKWIRCLCSNTSAIPHMHYAMAICRCVCASQVLLLNPSRMCIRIIPFKSVVIAEVSDFNVLNLCLQKCIQGQAASYSYKFRAACAYSVHIAL